MKGTSNILPVLAACLVCAASVSNAQIGGLNRKASEQYIADIDTSLIIPGTLTETPDGKTFAYAARTQSRQFIVLQGERQREYEGIGSNGVFFSSDGKHHAYFARFGPQYFVVVDGREQN